MGNEQSGDQEGEKDELNTDNNSQQDLPSNSTQNEEINTKTIMNDMFPEDSAIDHDIPLPTEKENIDSKSIEEFCPDFAEIIDYTNSRCDDFETAFKTKAIFGQSLQNTLNSLKNSIDVNRANLEKGKEQEDDEENEKHKNKLAKAQHLFENAISCFDQNNDLKAKEKSDQVYNDLEAAKETLKKKKEELNELKESCDRLLRQYIEMVNSQPV